MIGNRIYRAKAIALAGTVVNCQKENGVIPTFLYQLQKHEFWPNRMVYSLRNNAGYWMKLVGVFRWMDLTGVAAYRNVMKDLFPTLTNTEVPKLIDDIVKNCGKSIAKKT